MKIDAFLIGAPRTMTTKIHECMSSHKQIATSNPKELKYFSIHHGDEDYLLSHYDEFEIESKDKIIYSNPIDCNMDYVADRIQSHNPGAKIIMGIRSPIERAISHYGIHRFKLPQGRVCKNIFDEFDRNENNFSKRKFLCEGDFIPYCNEYGSCYVQQYFECSLYFNMYLKYSERFEDIHIYTFDDLSLNFNSEYNKILNFIGVESDNSQPPTKTNSLTSWGGDLDFEKIEKQFRSRYPDIVREFIWEAEMLSPIIGVDLVELWRLK